MQAIHDIVKLFREADPKLSYLGLDEPVTFGKFLEFEYAKWNGKIRIVPTERSTCQVDQRVGLVCIAGGTCQ